MTSSEIARVFRARRSGKGKWQARCTAHPDRLASLSITDMGGGKTRVHCFAGCAQADVLKAAGLTWRDLRPDGPVPLEIRRQMTLEECRERLERQMGLVAVLQALERGKVAYWAAAERRIRGEIDEVRCRLEPEAVWREVQAQRLQERIRRVGWEAMWEEAYGVHTAGSITAAPVRTSANRRTSQHETE